MKYLILLACVFFSFVLGYLLGASLRFQSKAIIAGQDAGTDVVQEAAPSQQVVSVPEFTSVPQVVPTEPANPAESAEPETVVTVEPAQPTAVATPAPQPSAETNQVSVAAINDDEIRQLMHRSIETAEIRHFTSDQIIAWKEFGEEVIDGVTYQFGILTYQEQSIFGERDFDAKALIRDGKVEKWIWPSNGMRIP